MGRTTALTEQEYFRPDIMVLVDKPITGSGDWLQARSMYIGLLGNLYIQGSVNNINWHDEITASDTYFRFSSDGGTTWKALTTANIREDTNLYYTEARVSANTDVAANTSARHTHANQSILDNIGDGGSGNTFLADDGTYKLPFQRYVTTQSTNYTVGGTDDIILADATTGNVTITLPTAVGITGKLYMIKCIDDTNTCLVDTTGVETIDGESSIQLYLNESITVVSDGTNYYIV